MSFHVLLVRTQELNFIALPVTRVRAGPFLGMSLSVYRLLHTGLPEIRLPFKRGNKTPCTSCFELLLLLRCPGSESPSPWHRASLRCSIIAAVGTGLPKSPYYHLLVSVRVPNSSLLL